MLCTWAGCILDISSKTFKKTKKLMQKYRSTCISSFNDMIFLWSFLFYGKATSCFLARFGSFHEAFVHTWNWTSSTSKAKEALKISHRCNRITSTVSLWHKINMAFSLLCISFLMPLSLSLEFLSPPKTIISHLARIERYPWLKRHSEFLFALSHYAHALSVEKGFSHFSTSNSRD